MEKESSGFGVMDQGYFFAYPEFPQGMVRRQAAVSSLLMATHLHFFSQSCWLPLLPDFW